MKNSVDDDTMDRFMTRLPFEVKLLDQSILTGDEEAFKVSLNACHEDNLHRFKADLTIYLKACKISHYSPGRVTFLITQDYKFFKTFIRSPDVEDCLGRVAKEVLGIPTAVAVQVAGEVIKD